MSAPFDQNYFDWCAAQESHGWHIVSVAVKAISGTMGHTEPKVAGPLDTMADTLGELALPRARFTAVTSPYDSEAMGKVNFNVTNISRCILKYFLSSLSSNFCSHPCSTLSFPTA